MEPKKVKVSTIVYYFCIVILVIMQNAIAQTLYLPTTHDVYPFLKKMESKGYLSHYRDAALPLSRKDIAQYLKSLEQYLPLFTKNEKDSYYFFTTEFKYELLLLEGDNDPSEIRWHAISTKLFEGQMNLDPNFWYEWRKEGNDLTRIRTMGFKLYGYAYTTVGYYFNLVDNVEKADRINPSRIYSDGEGFVVSTMPSPHEFHHDDNDVQLSVQIGRVSLSIEKSKNVWGYGQRGSVIFSRRPPSYPMVKLRFPLSESIDFIYFHGELNSDIVDTTRSYVVVYPNFSAYRRVDRAKYIAAHQIEFTIVKGLDLSLGESVVYSDKGPLLVYCIPIMFFKAAEHYNRDVDNTQLFGSLDLTMIRNMNIYTTLFIDEINTDELFDEYKSRKQIAYTIGSHIYDIPFTNVGLQLEYTRANPGVYNHKYPTATFTNSSFSLGTWIGQNADLFYTSIYYEPLFNLRVSAFYERYRKGEDLPIVDQYAVDQGRKSFLFGKRHKEATIGISTRYQPVRDVFINSRVQWRDVTDESEPQRNRTKQLEFSVSMGVGLW